MQLVLPDFEMAINVGPGRSLDDDEFFEFCAQNRKVRIEREATGEIVIMPPAGFTSGYRNNEICRQLGNWARTDGRSVALDSNTEYFLPDGSAKAPDASWVPNNRLAAFAPDEMDRFLPLCPDFVVELMSPSDRLTRAMAKMAQWIENGAALGWLVDPGRRVVYVYRPGRDPEELVDAERIVGEGPVIGFTLELSDIWRGPRTSQ